MRLHEWPCILVDLADPGLAEITENRFAPFSIPWLSQAARPIDERVSSTTFLGLGCASSAASKSLSMEKSPIESITLPVFRSGKCQNH